MAMARAAAPAPTAKAVPGARPTTTRPASGRPTIPGTLIAATASPTARSPAPKWSST
jgi:hypothetical protein